MSGWDTAAEPRIRSRQEYGVGPAAGPNIYRRYKVTIAKVLSKQGKSARVLLLGATPELRDLVLDYNVQLVSLDVVPKILEDMSTLMKHKNDVHEVRVIGDWRDMPFAEKEFDFILGDGITNNIIVSDHDQLWKEFARVLKDDGYILLRDSVAQPLHQRHSIGEIINTAHRKKWHKYDLWFEIYFYSSDGGFQSDKQYIDMRVTQQKLERNFYGKEIFTSEEEEYMKKFTQGSVKTTFVAERVLLQNLKKYFKLIEVYQEDDYRYCESFKFFLGQKKVRKFRG